jgi:hypothetical protein
MKFHLRLGASSSLLRGACLAAFLSTALVGCGKPGTLFNTSPLGPLMVARHTTDNAVRSLKKLQCEKVTQNCIDGRLRYNRAASSVNAVLSHLIIAIEVNSDIVDEPGFRTQIESSLRDSLELQKFLENVSNPSETGEILKLDPININTLLPALLQSIAGFVKEARQADARQRVTTVCELKSLVLPAFDEIEKSTFPKDCEKSLLEPLTPAPSK